MRMVPDYMVPPPTNQKFRVSALVWKRVLGFVKDVMRVGSIISTDGWTRGNFLPADGYNHERCVQSGSGDPAHVVLPGPPSIASLQKR
jgi:hypothetical protein